MSIRVAKESGQVKVDTRTGGLSVAMKLALAILMLLLAAAPARSEAAPVAPVSAAASLPVPQASLRSVVECVKVDDMRCSKTGELRLPPGRHRVAFFFRVSADAAEGLQSRYLLEGLDREWTVAGPSGGAIYHNLPPGTYRFQVQAGRPPSGWTGSGTSAALSVAPRPSETTPFRLLVAMLSVAICAALYTWRLKQHRSRERGLLALLEQRTAALRQSERDARRARDELKLRVHERTIELVRGAQSLEANLQARRGKEEKLTRAKLLAERASQSKTELLSSMSQQLRVRSEELTALAESALAGELQEAQREILFRVKYGAGGLTRVADAMLGFVRMEQQAVDEDCKKELTADQDGKARNFAIL